MGMKQKIWEGKRREGNKKREGKRREGKKIREGKRREKELNVGLRG